MLEKIVETIKTAKKPLTLDLNSSSLKDAEVEALAEAIKKARVPLILYLSSNDITISSLRLLADAIKAVQFELKLYLVDNNIRVCGTKLLAEAIKVAQVPLSLNLRDNSIGKSGARLLAEAIKVARIPLNLGLGWNSIKCTGAGHLVEAIKVARVPLTLDLGSNSIGEVGAKLLAEAIKLAEVPLNLDLRFNMIGDVGAGLLAGAIKEKKVPLGLCLSGNFIGRDGIAQIVTAIENTKSPITLDVSGNSMENISISLLADAIKKAKVPFALDWSVSDMWISSKKLLQYAITNNFVVDARQDPSDFLERTGLNLCNKMLERVLLYPAVLAKLITSYISDDDLAWTEVAAIRAVDGASYENKYSSIDITLINSVYFKTPVTVKPLIVAEPLLMTESTEKEGNYTSSVVTDNENKGDKNTDGAEGRESSSSSSIYSRYGETHSERLSNQYSIGLQYGSYNHQQMSDNNQGHDTESLLTRFFAWIKDLPKHQKQEILSSFSMQRVLKVLGITRDKIIAEQLNSKQLEEIFTTEYQNYYEQENCIDSSQAYAHIKKLEPAMLLCGTESQILGESYLLQNVVPI